MGSPTPALPTGGGGRGSGVNAFLTVAAESDSNEEEREDYKEECYHNFVLF